MLIELYFDAMCSGLSDEKANQRNRVFAIKLLDYGWPIQTHIQALMLTRRDRHVPMHRQAHTHTDIRRCFC